MRAKKAFYNTTTAFIFEIITIISGFLIPRLILEAFGSNYNGVTATISQFIGYISLLTVGVTSVSRAALYKPLANNDNEEISRVVLTTELFMKKISKIFLFGLILFSVIYPFLVKEFDWLFTFTLSLIIGIGTFANYYFGVTYRTLISADQRTYIIRIVQIFVTTLNTIISIFLLKSGSSIHIVKLANTIIFLINPLFIYFYGIKKYKINKKVKPKMDLLDQRWEAFAHQISEFVNSNVDILILSIFSNVAEVSVYTVYYLVYNGVFMLVNTFTTGSQAAFGNMFARNEKENINRNFDSFVLLLHFIGLVLFISMALLIEPFVMIYTNNVNDVNYSRYAFGITISIIGFLQTVRIPFQVIVYSVGHFKQTKNGAIIETILNVLISLILVKPLGLMGLAIGTLTATLVRTIQYSLYVYKNILLRPSEEIFKRYIITFITGLISYILFKKLSLSNPYNLKNWFINGLIIVSISTITSLFINYIFYKKIFKNLVISIKNVLKFKKVKRR